MMIISAAMSFWEWFTQELFEDFFMYSLLAACFVLLVITCMIIFATVNWERKKHAARKRAAKEAEKKPEEVTYCGTKADPLNFDGTGRNKE